LRQTIGAPIAPVDRPGHAAAAAAARAGLGEAAFEAAHAAGRALPPERAIAEALDLTGRPDDGRAPARASSRRRLGAAVDTPT
jgi:hypothetical protein